MYAFLLDIKSKNNVNSGPRGFQTEIHGLSANHIHHIFGIHGQIAESDALVNSKSRVA
jgi:hypothetical protein